jgi:hypothetical protein
MDLWSLIRKEAIAIHQRGFCSGKALAGISRIRDLAAPYLSPMDEQRLLPEERWLWGAHLLQVADRKCFVGISNRLAAAAHRLARFEPKLVLADLTAPLPLRQAAFQSIHLGYLLHCLPGPMEAKGKVLENLLPHLHPTGVLFGSTQLPGGGNAFARRPTSIYNQRGIFGNAGDTMEGLEHMLAARFSRVSLERVGQATLFALRK